MTVFMATSTFLNAQNTLPFFFLINDSISAELNLVPSSGNNAQSMQISVIVVNSGYDTTVTYTLKKSNDTAIIVSKDSPEKYSLMRGTKIGTDSIRLDFVAGISIESIVKKDTLLQPFPIDTNNGYYLLDEKLNQVASITSGEKVVSVNAKSANPTYITQVAPTAIQSGITHPSFTQYFKLLLARAVAHNEARNAFITSSNFSTVDQLAYNAVSFALQMQPLKNALAASMESTNTDAGIFVTQKQKFRPIGVHDKKNPERPAYKSNGDINYPLGKAKRSVKYILLTKNGEGSYRSYNPKKEIETDRFKFIEEDSAVILDANLAVRNNMLVLDNVKLTVWGEEAESGKSRTTSTISYPISLRNPLYKQYLIYQRRIGGENYTFRLRVSQILDYCKSPYSKSVSYFIKQESGHIDREKEDTLRLSKQGFPNFFNVVGYYHMSQAIGQRSDESNIEDDEQKPRSNAQIELQLNMPVNGKNNGRIVWAPHVNGTVNFSPLGKSSPFYLFDYSDSTNVLYGDSSLPRAAYRIEPFDLMRNYYLQWGGMFSVFRVNHTSGLQILSHDFELGFRHYLTKLRTNNIVDSAGNRNVNYDKKIDVSTIGPYFNYKFDGQIEDIFGFDLNLGAQYLFTQEGIGYNFEKFRKVNNVVNYVNNRFVFVQEMNFYAKPFAKVNPGNPSGVYLRLRSYQPVGTAVNLHYELMIGYALNLNTLIR